MRTIDALKSEGYHPVMAAELEFYLLDRQRDANGRPQPARDADGGRPRATQVYGLRELEQIEPFRLTSMPHARRRACRHARRSRNTPRQVEITSTRRRPSRHGPGDPLKRLVKGVAQKHGMLACFMAKPFDDLAGTGMHLHVSLADEQGHNLFASDDPAGTPLLRQAVGGMLASLLDSLLLFCPNANSYRRFQANSYAPLAQTWGVDNRTVSLRMPGGPASSRHIEHRICGADANPTWPPRHSRRGPPRHPRRHRSGRAGGGQWLAQAGKRLPTDWLTALDALQRLEWAREAFGEPFLGVYLAVKRAEYRQFMGEVGEQDWRWYLTQA